jgi:hypothetical protein
MEDHFQRAQDAEIFDGHLHCGTDRDEFHEPTRGARRNARRSRPDCCRTDRIIAKLPAA